MIDVRRCIRPFLLAIAIVPAARAGEASIEGQVVAAYTSGSVDGLGDLDEFFDLGTGLRGGLFFRLAPAIWAGGQIGYYRVSQEELQSFPGDTDLTALPVHGMVQLRTPFGLFAQGGLGFTRHSVDDEPPKSVLVEGSQTSFSWSLGGGLAIGLPGPVAITLGVDYHATEPGEGEVWGPDDSPRAWLFSAGVRIDFE